MAWWTWQNGCGAYLIRPLNESDGELRAECHHGSAPGLSRGRISEAVGLKMLARSIKETLCALIVDVESASPEFELRRHSTRQRLTARRAR